MAELYAAMYDRGYNPSRGLGPVFAVMLSLAALAIAVMMLTVLTLMTGHTFWVEQIVVRYL
jgi:hypothetical protein